MSDLIKIHVLHCGEVQMDNAMPFKQKTLNPIAYSGLFRSRKNQITMPVSAYLIEHPKGLVLIDTGWHADVRRDQKQHMGRLNSLVSKAILPEGHAIHEQLAAKGIRPKDLDYVVLSHMDIDHTSGLQHVREAKRILTSEPEWEAVTKGNIRYLRHLWGGMSIGTFKMTRSDYGPECQSADLFGDGSIVFVHTPGHSSGLTSTLIQNQDAFVLLAADTGYAKRSWEEMILPGITVSKEHARKSLQWVRDMSKLPGCVEVIANHDPECKPHVIKL
ncbi:N-acyl homoserine lactonase family protein [Gorillibacterium sp. CAU 1737]|uniref:N-acyl homoserine lactonase family protein n=1 Tax=Gorillibacterium sp. CAU 1737 TaxID=3140362 RepID=UPI0032605026